MKRAGRDPERKLDVGVRGFVTAYSGHLQEARSIPRRAALQAEQAGQPERAACGKLERRPRGAIRDQSGN